MDNFRVDTVRYRYLKDKRTGRVPTYTEWKLYKNDELISSRRCGQGLNSVTQFINWVKEKYNITQTITRTKTRTHSLGFNAQNL